MRTQQIEEGILKIPQIETQLDNNTKQTNNSIILNKGITPIFSVDKNLGYKFYQVVIKNPFKNKAIINKPVGIKVFFDDGECKNEKCITILNSNNAEVDFQLEEEVTEKGVNNSKYASGYLKCVTLWIKSDFLANEEKVCTLKISETETTKSFTKNVTHTVVSADEEKLSCGSVELQLLKKYAWLNQDIKLGSYTYHTNNPFWSLKYKNGSKADVIHNDNCNIISHNIIGSGVMYLDSVTVATFKPLPSLQFTVTQRLWFNGTWETHIEFKTLSQINGELNGCQASNYINLSTESGFIPTFGVNDGNKKHYTALIGESYKILSTLYYGQVEQEMPDDNIKYYSIGAFSIYNNNGQTSRQIGQWSNLQSDSPVIPQGSNWNFHFIATHNFTAENNEDVINDLKNPLYAQATKYNVYELKNMFIDKSKQIINTNRLYIQDNVNFRGANALEHLCAYEVFGDKSELEKAKYWEQICLDFYQGGTYDGFCNRGAKKWLLEFIGRDASYFDIARRFYLRQGDLINSKKWETVMFNLADAIVEMERQSGGNGDIALNGDALNSGNYNSRATGMKYLHQALLLQEKKSWRDCFNRCNTKFIANLFYVNKLPYVDNTEITYYNRTHYANYTLFEYSDTTNENNVDFSFRSFINEQIKPSGCNTEKGFNQQRNKWGLLTNILYGAGVLYRVGDISSLQTACNILDYCLNRRIPSGGMEFPLDGWKTTEQHQYSARIESQIVAEIIINELYS